MYMSYVYTYGLPTGSPSSVGQWHFASYSGGPNYGHPKKSDFTFLVTVCYLSIFWLSNSLEVVAEGFLNILGRKNFQKDQRAISYEPIKEK